MPREPAGRPALDAEAVKRLAATVRIALTPDEARSLGVELTEMVARLDLLEALDPGDAPGRGHGGGFGEAAPAVAPSSDGSGPGRESSPPPPLRPDEPGPDPLLRPLSDLAPEWRDGFVLVPRVR